MNLNNLPKVTQRKKKRMGRGLGSGKGKTGVRGSKGQKARGAIPALFIGGALALYRKLPYRRGFARHGGNPPKPIKPVLVRTSQLNVFKQNSIVNVESLIKNNIVSESDAKKKSVKILARGELKVKLTIENISISNKARKQVEQSGGKIVV